MLQLSLSYISRFFVSFPCFLLKRIRVLALFLFRFSDEGMLCQSIQSNMPRLFSNILIYFIFRQGDDKQAYLCFQQQLVFPYNFFIIGRTINFKVFTHEMRDSEHSNLAPRPQIQGIDSLQWCLFCLCLRQIGNYRVNIGWKIGKIDK